MQPSEEQEVIIDQIKQNKNIVIEAVAGSGKTTTLLFISNKYKTKRISLLTYSRSLKDEILSKTIPDNLSVFTFHSFASYIYKTVIHNDYLLNIALLKNKIRDLTEIDILMVDEVQDMTKQYFLLTSIIINMFKNIRIILVGDHKQTIKDYIGAYPEFLTDAENIYKKYTTIEGDWVKCKLSKSYRLTENTTNFINKHIYNFNYIVSGNTRSKNLKPDYLPINSLYISKNKLNPDITKIIYHYIKIYKISNVLILAPSYKVNNPGYLLAHELSHISHILPNQDLEEKLNPLLLKNKLVFRTFASCKGLQSKCVIIIGLDENYFKYNDRKWSDNEKIPNILSVATTRALEKLVIIAHESNTLRTIQVKELKDDVKILCNSNLIKPFNKSLKICNTDPDFKRSVIDFVKHKHPEVELIALSYLNIEYNENYLTNNSVGDLIIKFITKSQEEIYESISHIYGRIIPKIFRWIITKEPVLYYDELSDYYFEKFDNYLVLYNEYMDYLNSLNKNDDIDYIKYIKHIFACELLLESSEIKSQYLVRQINNFNWININVIKNSIDFLINYFKNINGILLFEEQLNCLKYKNTTITGRADIINVSKNIIYELKYSENVMNDHFLQVGVYLSMMKNIEYGEIICYPSGLVVKVSINKENIEPFINVLTLSGNNIYEGFTMYDILDKYMNEYKNNENIRDLIIDEEPNLLDNLLEYNIINN